MLDDMRTLLSIFLFLILSSKSYSLELSVEGLTDALGDVTKELEKVVQDNSMSEETETETEIETELETSTKDNNETKNNDSSSLISDSDENSKICKKALSKYDYFSGFDENVTGNFLGGQDYLEVKNKIISEKKTFICPECKSTNVNLLEVNDIYRTQNGEGRGEFEWIFAEGNLNGYVKGWTLMDNNILVQVVEVQGGSLSNGIYVIHLIVKKFSDNSDQGTMLFCLDEEESNRGYWTVDSQGNETRHKYYQSNYQKFDLQVNKKTMEQETKKTVDKSKGGYKDFYFDMNISQIKNVVNQVCPQAEFSDKTSWGESLGYWDAPSCIDFRGKKTSLNFYTSKEDTIDKIILKNVDLSLDSMDFATYYSEDESGFVIYDEIVGKFLDSAKYELVRFPTKEEIDLFNSFDDLKILTGDASVNTVFKNLKTGNLVYHTMKRNKYNNYGYEYDLIYLSPNASKSILKEEDSKTVSDDDI